MSQKTNPTLLRLKKTNKDFSYFWHGDYFYGQLNNYSLLLHNYIKQVNTQIGHSQALLFFDIYYKRCFAYMFFLDARGLREKRGSDMRISWLQMISQTQKNQPLVQKTVQHVNRNSLAVQDQSSRTAELCSATPEGKTTLSKQKERMLLSKILRDNMLELKFQPTRKKKTTGNYTSLNNFVFVSCKSFLSKQPGYSSISRHALNDFCTPPVTASKQFDLPLSRQEVVLRRHDNSVVVTAVKDPVACTTQQSGARARSKAMCSQLMNFSKAIDKCFLSTANLCSRFSSSLENISFGTSDVQDKANSLCVIKEFTKTHPLWLSTVCPIRVIEDTQNAHLLAGEIVYLLEKRVSFKKIKDQVLREIVKKDHVKGVRLSCSGRVASRSKKAQKTKTQFIQWGDTSLHVFDSKLSFSYKSAHTAFGKVGVKAWLCYK